MSKPIVTHYDPPPIRFRGADWTAYREGYDPESTQPTGTGATEREAINALLDDEDAP